MNPQLNDDEWTSVVSFLDIHTVLQTLGLMSGMCHLFDQNSLWNSLIHRDFTQEQIESAGPMHTSKHLYKHLYIMYFALPYRYPPDPTQKRESIPQSQVTKVLLHASSTYIMMQLQTMLQTGEWVGEAFEMTIGASFYTVVLSPLPNRVAALPRRLEIWVPSGPERFASLTPMYYRGASIILCVYNTSDSKNSLELQRCYGSLNSALVWANEAQKIKEPNVLAVVLVAIQPAKSKSYVVPDSDVKNYCDERGYLFMKISETTSGRDIRELVRLITRLHRVTPPDQVATQPAIATTPLQTPASSRCTIC